MIFKVYLTKELNYLFFLKCLSNFYLSPTSFYKKEWLKIIGPLSKRDQKIIEEFSKLVFSLRSKISSFNELFFLTRKSHSKKQNKIHLAEKDRKIIEKMYRNFYIRYEKYYWKKISKVAVRTKLEFCRLLKNFSYTPEIIKILEHFYRARLAEKKIKLILIILPESVETIRGTTILTDKVILLEGKIQKFSQKRILAVLFHELIHLTLENNYLIPLINKCLEELNIPQKRKKIIAHQIREVIAWTLLPDGCLARRYFQEARPFYLKAKIPRVAQKIMPVVEKYIEHKKSIDKNLIKKVIRLLY